MWTYLSVKHLSWVPCHWCQPHAAGMVWELLWYWFGLLLALSCWYKDWSLELSCFKAGSREKVMLRAVLQMRKCKPGDTDQQASYPWVSAQGFNFGFGIFGKSWMALPCSLERVFLAMCNSMCWQEEKQSPARNQQPAKAQSFGGGLGHVYHQTASSNHPDLWVSDPDVGGHSWLGSFESFFLRLFFFALVLFLGGFLVRIINVVHWVWHYRR